MPIRYIVFMGVSGCGKSTVGRRVAERLGWTFVEGDDLHPASNVEKMRHGVPLDEADRKPWLDSVARTLRQWRSEGHRGVISCSALRRTYRDIIADGGTDVLFAHLHGSREQIARRLVGRRGHFMPVDLLDSQFAVLEEPVVPLERAMRLDIDRPPEALVREVLDVVSGSAVA